MKRFGFALAQASISSAVVGTCFTRSGAYSMIGPPGDVITITPWPLATACILTAAGSRTSSSFGKDAANAGSNWTHNFCSMPADRPSRPVSTRSMSTRLASCCALILPGSSGAGALVKLNFDTRLGLALA